ncbi:hypothetical protein LUZ60_011017 [Juncus effusus]|nr:hypothetical protein LUZ60_011017 [Juncus effusus]
MDPPHSPIHIKHEGKFYARLLTKESSMTAPSFRYYGVGPGSIPFVWESTPGTPKVILSDTSIPAITPPPSYQTHYNTSGKKIKRNRTRFFVRISAIKAMFRWFRVSKGKKREDSRVRVSNGSSRWLFSLPVGDGGEAKYVSPPKHGLMCFSVRRVPRVLFLWYRRK